MKHSFSGESYQAYVPNPLPPIPVLDLAALMPSLEKATIQLAELKVISHNIPNHALFIYMYVRKEALLSSQIEGTQSSFSDLILFENKQKPHVSIEDVEEVSNYVKAIQYGLTKLREGFPLSLRLIKEIHAILLSGGRGGKMQPGEFRKSQNWIGGTRPGNTIFVPPPANHLMDCLGDLETFLHDRSFPLLIRTALTHIQFETIHPFLDGNGRMGRLLISLMLFNEKMLEQPVLYLSLYLKQNRKTYYDLLQEVRMYGTWETWVEFFLKGIEVTSKQAILTTQKIQTLFHEHHGKIQTLGRARFSCEEALEQFKRLPQFSVPHLSKVMGVSQPTARTSLKHLCNLNIIEEVSNKQRDRIYLYKSYLDILEEGTTPV